MLEGCRSDRRSLPGDPADGLGPDGAAVGAAFEELATGPALASSSSPLSTDEAVAAVLVLVSLRHRLRAFIHAP